MQNLSTKNRAEITDAHMFSARQWLLFTIMWVAFEPRIQSVPLCESILLQWLKIHNYLS